MEELWWAMHHSEAEDRQSAVITCYLDESGTDENSATAVVGGILLERSAFLAFNTKWRGILSKHGVEPPLHMKEFGRPHGRLARFSDDQRRRLFSDLVRLINQHKVTSVAGTLTTAEYRVVFGRSPGLMSFYGACFLLCVLMNHLTAKNTGYPGRIAYLMDAGNPYAQHVREAHAGMLEKQDLLFLNLGALAFDDDRVIDPLQAADLVSWAVRKSMIGKLRNGFQPLEGLFDRHHVQHGFGEAHMREIAARFQELQGGRRDPQ